LTGGSIPTGTFVSSQVSLYVGLLLGMYLMYRYYVSGNKKHEVYVQEITSLKEKLKQQMESIESKYINQEITKREYELLMNKCEKMMEKY
jgi:uncharacterized membrane-anchored protein YhcB (DUF1043 family)